MPTSKREAVRTSRSRRRVLPSLEADLSSDSEVVSVRENEESWKDCEVVPAGESEDSWKDCEEPDSRAENEPDARLDATIDGERDTGNNRGRDVVSAAFVEALNAKRSKLQKSLESLKNLECKTREAELKKDKDLLVLENFVDDWRIACLGQSFKNKSELMDMDAATYNRCTGFAAGTVANGKSSTGNGWNCQPINRIDNVIGTGICVEVVPYFVTEFDIKIQLADTLGAQFNQTMEVMLQRIHEVSRMKWRNPETNCLQDTMKVKLILDAELEDYIMRNRMLKLRDGLYHPVRRYLSSLEYDAQKRPRNN